MMGGRARAELNAKVKRDKNEKNYADVGNGKLVLLSSGAWAWQDEHQWQLSPRLVR